MAITPGTDEQSWKDIEAELPRNWRDLAVQHGFCTSADAPDLPCKLRQILVLAANSTSLRTTVSLFAAAALRAVSHVTLHNWFRAAPAFLAALLLALLDPKGRFAPRRWAGYRVRAVDASTVQRPGAKGATARLHCAIELNDMSLSECTVTDVKTGESLLNFRTGKDTLDLCDRGYSNAASIQAAVDQEGDILVRWNPFSLPLRKTGKDERIRARLLAETLREGEVDEWAAQVRPKGRPKPIPVRLIIARLPADKASQARERARVEHDGKPSAEVLFLAGFVMLVTTVPSTRLGTAQLIELYRLRWQVELHFKREKSIGGLDRLPNFIAATITSWILAKLVLSELGRRLVSVSGPDAPAPDSDPPPSFAQAPWEAAVLGSAMLRGALLPIPTAPQARRTFVGRFLSHLARLKASGRRRRRQIEDFLGGLAARASLA